MPSLHAVSNKWVPNLVGRLSAVIALGMALALSALALPAAAQEVPAASPARPNILFILTDDQAAWTLSGGSRPHPNARTPVLDQLAREGAYLVNAFAITPVCSPSRAELLTSRYGTELGITDWIQPQREPGLGLDPRTVTWPELLQQAGYTTGLIGKWHLGEEPRFQPTSAGYGSFFGFLGGGTTPRNPVLRSGGVEREFEGFTTEILADSAIAFLRGNQRRPFVLSLHFRAPHAPWLPLPDEDWSPFRDLDPQLPDPDYPKLDIPRAKRMTREYLASVASVDRNVGRILRSLDELGLRDRTVVVFTSDHGYNMAHNGIWHKGNGHWLLTDPPPATGNVPRGQRPNMYDNSLRVPAIVRWPGVVRPGTVVRHTITHLDWYPTLLAMAGVPLPGGIPIRGRNFLPLLRGESVPGWDDDLYAEYSTHHQSWTHMRAYRTAEWKLVRDFLDPKRDELYHLSADPDESDNLIHSTDPAARRALSDLDALIVSRMRELKDPVLRLAEERGDE